MKWHVWVGVRTGVAHYIHGIHYGSGQDGEQVKNYGPIPALEDGEEAIYDGATKGIRKILVPYWNKKGHVLQPQQLDANGVHGHIRAPSEHFFGQAWNWRIVNTPWRATGSDRINRLELFSRVLLKFINFVLLRQFKYEPSQPWPLRA